MALDGLEGVDTLAIDVDDRSVLVWHHDADDAVLVALDALNLATTFVTHRADLEGEQVETAATERTVLLAALLINAVFFVVEFGAGIVSDSMGLIADSLDNLADATVYLLSLIAVGGTVARKKSLAATSGYLQLGLAAIGLVEVVRRFVSDAPMPDARTMIIVSLLALGGNVVTLLLLRRARSPEAHFQASWIFTANDIKVNTLVIGSALVVAATNNPAADLLAGAAIFIIVANGARRILAIAK
jgi:Co/Zn/Cd efflux system component